MVNPGFFLPLASFLLRRFRTVRRLSHPLHVACLPLLLHRGILLAVAALSVEGG